MACGRRCTPRALLHEPTPGDRPCTSRDNRRPRCRGAGVECGSWQEPHHRLSPDACLHLLVGEALELTGDVDFAGRRAGPDERHRVAGKILAGAEIGEISARSHDALSSVQMALRADAIAQAGREPGGIHDRILRPERRVLPSRAVTPLAADAVFQRRRPVVFVLRSAAMPHAGRVAIQTLGFDRAGPG